MFDVWGESKNLRTDAGLCPVSSRNRCARRMTAVCRLSNDD